jgi:hypothetical protein
MGALRSYSSAFKTQVIVVLVAIALVVAAFFLGLMAGIAAH